MRDDARRDRLLQPRRGCRARGRFTGLARARRAVDTRERSASSTRARRSTVDVTAFVPADASSVVVNLTATECTGAGYFTVYPFTSPTVPTASSLNVNAAGETRAAAAIVPIVTGADGRRHINVFVLQAAKLIVDVTGYFTGTSSPMSEDRVVRARRSGAHPRHPRPGSDRPAVGRLDRRRCACPVPVPHPGRSSSTSRPSIRAAPATSRSRRPACCCRRRRTSTSPAAPGGAEPRDHPDHRRRRVPGVRQGGAHVLVDYIGYYTGSPAAAQTPPPTNPPPPPIAPEWILEVPSIGLQSTGDRGRRHPDHNAGHSWHWTGTGYIGQDAHVASFAHRTTAGGPYRNIHFLNVGDQFTLTASDRRQYTYQMVRRDLTNSRVDNILARDTPAPGHDVLVDRLHQAQLHADQHRVPHHRHRRARSAGASSDASRGRIASITSPGNAGLAQLVERLTCNHEVAGSIPAPGSHGSLNAVGAGRIEGSWPRTRDSRRTVRRVAVPPIAPSRGRTRSSPRRWWP